MGRAATPDELPWSSRSHDSGFNSERGAYGVDRDRIVHSESFRELQYKTAVRSPTAVLAPETHGSFRTRLNHVLEVAQLARALARALEANEALTEAIALAHDLGHPPFGHAGERGLAAAVKAAGGAEGDIFNANLHSLAVIGELECSFAEFRGLNPTWATREGVARHSTPFDVPISAGEFATTPQAGLESQIVDVADMIAYVAHDLDDALAADLVSLPELADTDDEVGRIVEEAVHAWNTHGARVWPTSAAGTVRRKRVVGRLTSHLFRSVHKESTRLLQQLDATPAAVRSNATRVVTGDEDWRKLTANLLGLLRSRYYRSDIIREADNLALGVIESTFVSLLANPHAVPERFQTGSQVANTASFIASLNDFSLLSLAKSLGAMEGIQQVDAVFRRGE
jgi:dGTPase